MEMSNDSPRPPSDEEPGVESTFTRRYARTVLTPLDPDEAATATRVAIEVVLRDGTVQQERTRVFGPALRIEKPRQRGGAPTRLVWVRIRDRDRGVIHDVSVKDGAVVEHLIDANANPPISAEERAEALQVISNDPELNRLVNRGDIEIEWFNPGAQGEGRLLGARFVRVEDHRVVETIAHVVVELDKGALHLGRDER